MDAARGAGAEALFQERTVREEDVPGPGEREAGVHVVVDRQVEALPQGLVVRLHSLGCDSQLLAGELPQALSRGRRELGMGEEEKRDLDPLAVEERLDDRAIHLNEMDRVGLEGDLDRTLASPTRERGDPQRAHGVPHELAQQVDRRPARVRGGQRGSFRTEREGGRLQLVTPGGVAQ
jgi:hypothetical protein